MEITTIDQLKQNVYSLRLRACGPYGYNTPFEKLLPVCRDVLKTAVCDKLGLDVDEVIETMLKNAEHFNNSLSEGTTLLYTYYIIKDCSTWFTNVCWDGNKKCGETSEYVVDINLNALLDINWEYIDVKKESNNVIQIYGGSHYKYTCKKSRYSLNDFDVYLLHHKKRYKVTGQVHQLSFIDPNDHASQYYKHWKLFDTKDECIKYVSTVFSEDENLKHVLDETKKKYDDSIKRYENAKKKLKEIEDEMKEYEKQYFELIGQ